MEHNRYRASGWAVAAAVGVLFLLVYLLRFVVLPFVFAAVFAYIGQPVLTRLRTRLHLPHVAAVVVVFLFYLVAIGGFLYWLGSEALPEFQQFLDGIPETVNSLVSQAVGEEGIRFGDRAMTPREVTEQIVGGTGQWLGPAYALQAASLTVGMISGFFLTFVVLFYFLLHGHRLAQGTLWLVPPPYRSRIGSFAKRVDPMLGRYIRGIFFVMVFTTVVTWIVLTWVLRLPNATLLALMTGLLEPIPVIGPVVAATILGVVSIHRGEIWLVAGFVLFYTALRLMIDEVIEPLILGKAVTLHPVVVIFSFLVGGALFGIVGMLLAVPTAATIKIVLSAYYEEPEAAQ